MSGCQASGEPGANALSIICRVRTGNRRIRVHNMQFSMVDKLASVFAKADLEVVLLSIIRQTCSALESSPLGVVSARDKCLTGSLFTSRSYPTRLLRLTQVRENVKQACVALLREYRQRCSGCTNKAVSRNHACHWQSRATFCPARLTLTDAHFTCRHS